LLIYICQSKAIDFFSNKLPVVFRGHGHNTSKPALFFNDSIIIGKAVKAVGYGSVIFGSIGILICVGIIILVVRLVIAFAKVFLFIGIIIGVIILIGTGINGLVYLWQNYIWTDFGRTIMVWAGIGLAGLITWRVIARRRYWKKEEEEYLRKIKAGEILTMKCEKITERQQEE
jgi:hypothetical protein